LDRTARPAGHRRLPHRHRLRVRHHQPDRGHPLFAARSARAARRGTGMTTGPARQATAPRSAAKRERGPLARFAAEFFESRLAAIGFGMLVLVLLAALLAPWIAPQNPYDLSRLDIMDSAL